MLDFKLTQPQPETEPGAEATTEDQPCDLIILGGGPAGLTAALYASRARIKTLILAGSLPGGQPANTDIVENYPGFPEGIVGAELAQRFQSQAERFGARTILDTVTEVDFSVRPFTVRTYGATYHAPTVIVATGAVPRLLGVPGEDKFFGRGVSVCATCDGFFYRDKRVVVVGGGDSAVSEAIFLTRFAREVIIVHRRDELRATKIYQEQALANAKIRFVWDTVVEEVIGDQTVTGVRVRNRKTDETSTIETDGVFVYIGMDPKTELFTGQIDIDEWGYIISNHRQETNIPGVFVAGDVQDPLYRQVVVAAGTGAIAAMEVEKFLGEYPQATTGKAMPTDCNV
jgi:thioredoxin reductase (NADPH)